EERYFPRKLLAIHPKYGTPHLSILFCAAIYVVLASYMSFIKLVELNVTLYGAALIPELIALLVLRYKEPDMPRPYRIPWGWIGVWATAILPIVVTVVAFCASLSDPEEGWRDQIPVLCL